MTDPRKIFRCPTCEATLRDDQRLHGRTITCPVCQSLLDKKEMGMPLSDIEEYIVMNIIRMKGEIEKAGTT